MMRYTIQEMKNSGFTYYQIIDTENKCAVVLETINYMLAAAVLGKLRRGEMEM